MLLAQRETSRTASNMTLPVPPKSRLELQLQGMSHGCAGRGGILDAFIVVVVVVVHLLDFITLSSEKRDIANKVERIFQ